MRTHAPVTTITIGSAIASTVTIITDAHPLLVAGSLLALVVGGIAHLRSEQGTCTRCDAPITTDDPGTIGRPQTHLRHVRADRARARTIRQTIRTARRTARTHRAGH
jgi:hypothetical protein